MADEKIVCMSCRKEFVYTEAERLFLEGLLKQKKIPEVIRPKKCMPCRALVRRARSAPQTTRPKPTPMSGWYTPPQNPKWYMSPENPALSPAPVPEAPSLPAPESLHVQGCMCPRCGDQSVLKEPSAQVSPAPTLAPAPGMPTPEEIVVLVASDFEALVCREDVHWRQGNRKITIRLADIGPEAMKRAMEKGVLSWWKS